MSIDQDLIPQLLLIYIGYHVRLCVFNAALTVGIIIIYWHYYKNHWTIDFVHGFSFFKLQKANYVPVLSGKVGGGGGWGVVFLPLSLCSNPNRQEFGQPRPVTPAESAQPINPNPAETSVADPDPGSGIQCFFDTCMRHFSESLVTVFWLKYLNSLMRIRNRDPGSRIFFGPDGKIRIRDPV